jgi:hypothetical protein
MRFFVAVYTAWGCKPQANSESPLEEDCEDKGIGFWEGFSLLFIPPGVANPRLIVKVLWKRTVRIRGLGFGKAFRCCLYRLGLQTPG